LDLFLLQLCLVLLLFVFLHYLLEIPYNWFGQLFGNVVLKNSYYYKSFIGGKKDEYCLKQNELLQVFQSFYIVYYEEKKSDHSDKFDQTASFVAIKTDLIV